MVIYKGNKIVRFVKKKINGTEYPIYADQKRNAAVLKNVIKAESKY
jgi:hypothetical protein